VLIIFQPTFRPTQAIFDGTFEAESSRGRFRTCSILMAQKRHCALFGRRPSMGSTFLGNERLHFVQLVVTSDILLRSEGAK
jgi:hypothetical protein